MIVPFAETELIPFFQWLLRTSVQASVLVCLILAVQAVLRRKLGARWHYCLWLLLLVRLIMPGAPQSSFSVFNLMPFGQGQQAAIAPEVIVPEPTAAPAARMPTPVPKPTTVAPAQPPGQPIPAQRAPFRVQPVPLIWALGALLVAVYAVGQNIALSSRIARQRQVTDEGVLGLLENCKETMGVRAYLSVVETPRVKSPALLGFIRPRLLLPEGMVETLDRDELRYVFLHELAHLKRRDIAVNWLMAALQLMHWFNPLIWYAFYRMRADREIACDALVLSRTQPGESQHYGRTIVNLLEHFSVAQRLPAVAGILEDRSQLKRRITMITRFRKDTYWRSALAIVLLLTVGCMALTDARGGRQASLFKSRSSLLPPDEEYEALLEERMEVMHKELDTSVSLDFAQGTDVRDILSFLSDFGRINIVLDERVMFPPEGFPTAPREETSTTTPRAIEPSIPSDIIRVYLKDIPLQDALEALLKPTGLGYVVQPHFVWVSRPDVLRHESFEPIQNRFALPRAARGDIDGAKAKLQTMWMRLRNSNVSADFAEGTDIRDIFGFLSDFAQVNIVLDERVMLSPAPPPPARRGPPVGRPHRPRERGAEDSAEEGTPGGITPNIHSEIRRTYLRDIALRDAMKAFLSQMGLSYSVQPEFVWVSRPDILRKESFELLETRQYQIKETDDPEKILARLRHQIPDIVQPYTGEVLSSMELNSETRALTVHHIPSRLKIVEEVLGVEGEPVIERRGQIEQKLGTRVSLDYSEGTDIRDVLSFLADFAGVNMVLDERVMLPPVPPPAAPGTPRVTVRGLPGADRADTSARPAVGGIERTIEGEIRRIYVKSIPLGHALVAICKPMGLDFIVLPEYVWVSRPDILRSEAREER
jgi:beta-lactamase regulating signal transducer with metallopeptidase domain